MAVYIDVFFIINLCADFVILSLPHTKTHILKRLAGATLGASYACLYFFKPLQILFMLPIKLFVLFIMCLISLYPCNMKRLFKYFIKTLLSSFFICGIIYCLRSLLAKPVDVPVSELFLAFGLSAGYIITVYASRYFKKKSVTDEHTIKIFYKDKSVTACGICDTGNSLCEPYCGFPVIICDISVLKRLISPHVTALNLCEFVHTQSFKAIPYKTVSSTGVMYGFIPDKIIINNTEITDVIIAPAQKALGEEILINPLIIKD